MQSVSQLLSQAIEHLQSVTPPQSVTTTGVPPAYSLNKSMCVVLARTHWWSCWRPSAERRTAGWWWQSHAGGSGKSAPQCTLYAVTCAAHSPNCRYQSWHTCVPMQAEVVYVSVCRCLSMDMTSRQQCLGFANGTQSCWWWGVNQAVNALRIINHLGCTDIRWCICPSLCPHHTRDDAWLEGFAYMCLAQ